jgi:hypothetical protein
MRVYTVGVSQPHLPRVPPTTARVNRIGYKQPMYFQATVSRGKAQYKMHKETKRGKREVAFIAVLVERGIGIRANSKRFSLY